MIKSKPIFVFFYIGIFVFLVACKPDKAEVEFYTSDIISALGGDVIEVPFIATFSLMGQDEDGDLPKAKTIVKRYLDKKAEINLVQGDWGDAMVVKCKIPFGKKIPIESFLEKNSRPISFVIKDRGNNDYQIYIHITKHLNNLNSELAKINMMLDVELPAKSTFIRVVGDMKKPMQILAYSVFVDKKPYTRFFKELNKRESLTLYFKGGDGSIYHAHSDQPIFFFASIGTN